MPRANRNQPLDDVTVEHNAVLLHNLAVEVMNEIEGEPERPDSEPIAKRFGELKPTTRQRYYEIIRRLVAQGVWNSQPVSVVTNPAQMSAAALDTGATQELPNSAPTPSYLPD